MGDDDTIDEMRIPWMETWKCDASDFRRQNVQHDMDEAELLRHASSEWLDC